MRRRGALATAALVALGGATASLPASAETAVAPARAAAVAPAGPQSGVVVGGNFFSSRPTFQAVSALGVAWVRAFVFWPTIEPRRGHYDEGTLAAYDRAIAQLAPGTHVLFVVTGAPRWASGSSDVLVPPRRARAFGRFAGFLAKRFKGRVAAWEIWNEEDSPAFWHPAPRPARYVRLLRAAYRAVKLADPGATVVLGGLTGNDYPFLRRVYRARGRGAFDAVGVHTDTACALLPPSRYLRAPGGHISQYSFLGYREVHATMTAHGDGAKPIYMTELGWSTSTKVCDHGLFAGHKAGGVDDALQASYLSRAYHCLAGDPYVRVAIWYQLQDFDPADTPIARFGLLRPDFSAKPAFAALADYSHAGDRLSGPCR